MSDEEHAKTVRLAVSVFNDLLRQAASDGVVVRLNIVKGHGAERNRDRSTNFDAVHISEVVRPL